MLQLKEWLKYFTIVWVAEDLDASVNGKPQVIIVKNGDPLVKRLNDDVVEELEKRAKEMKNKLQDRLEL